MRSNELGAYVEKLRRQQGWSQHMLSDEAVVSLRSVSSLESGLWQSQPSDATLSAVATALHEHPTTLSELLHRDLGYPPADVQVDSVLTSGILITFQRGTAALDPSPSDKEWRAIATAHELIMGSTNSALVIAATIADLFIPTPDQQEQLTGQAAALVARALMLRGACTQNSRDVSSTALHHFEEAQRLARVSGDRELRYQAQWYIGNYLCRQADDSSALGDYAAADRLYDLADDQLIGIIDEQEKVQESQRSLLALILCYCGRSNIIAGRGLRPNATIDFDAMQRHISRAVRYAHQAADHYAAATQRDPWLRFWVIRARSAAMDSHLYYQAMHGSLTVQEMQEQAAQARRSMPDLPPIIRYGTFAHSLARKQLWCGDPIQGLLTLRQALYRLDKQSVGYHHIRAQRLVREARDSDRLPLTMTLPCPRAGHGETMLRIMPGQQYYRCKVRDCNRVLLELP